MRAIAASTIGTTAALAAQTAEAMPAVFNADDLYNIAARRPLSTERWQRDGFPPPDGPMSRRRQLILIALLLLPIIAGFALLRDSDPSHAVRRPSQRELQAAALVSPASTSATRDAGPLSTSGGRPTRPTGVRTAHTPPAATTPASAETRARPLTAPSTPTLQPAVPQPATTTPVTTTPVTAKSTPVTVGPTATTTTAPRPTPTTAVPPLTTTTTAPPSA